MAQDILIKQTEDGSFDLVVGEQDFETVDGLETTLAVLLFTDARAVPEDVGDVSKRRGWVGNTLRPRELGGMLWLTTQCRNTQEIQNRIKHWAENSLRPLIDDGIASEIEVSVNQTEARRVVLQIHLKTRVGVSMKFDYWLNTDLGRLANAS